MNIARRAQANRKQLAVAHSSVDALYRQDQPKKHPFSFFDELQEKLKITLILLEKGVYGMSE